jgi:hypothetical protein
MGKLLEATIRVSAAAFRRPRADVFAEILFWPGGLYIAICVGLYIAATNLARGVSEWRAAARND